MGGVVLITGRLSSVNPNLQNIPIRSEQGGQIRQAFVPAPGWQLLTADYSQIELRLLAHYSEDEALQSAFAQDHVVDIMVSQVQIAEPFGTCAVYDHGPAGSEPSGLRDLSLTRSCGVVEIGLEPAPAQLREAAVMVTKTDQRGVATDDFRPGEAVGELEAKDADQRLVEPPRRKRAVRASAAGFRGKSWLVTLVQFVGSAAAKT